MPELTITIKHEAGLHARPLSQFVKIARNFDAEVQISNLTSGKGPVDGKSPLKLLLLAVLQGHDVKIECTGSDANSAIESLRNLIESNFEVKSAD